MCSDTAHTLNRDIYFKKYSPSEGGVEPVEVSTLVEPMKQEA